MVQSGLQSTVSTKSKKENKTTEKRKILGFQKKKKNNGRYCSTQKKTFLTIFFSMKSYITVKRSPFSLRPTTHW